MSLEQSLHTHWSGDAALTALLPLARVFSGPARIEPAVGQSARPYACWLRRSLPRVTRTSDRRIDHARMALRVYADDLPALKAIVEAAAARFDGQSFASDGVTVLSMRRVDHAEERHADGVWRAELDFELLAEGN